MGNVSSNNKPEQKATSVSNQVGENTVIIFPDKNLEKIIRDKINK